MMTASDKEVMDQIEADLKSPHYVFKKSTNAEIHEICDHSKRLLRVLDTVFSIL